MTLVPVHAPMEELRFRLYRPDPPDGALSAYLAALAAVEPPPRPTPPPRRAARPARILLTIAGVLVACVVGAVAPRLAPTIDAGPKASEAHASATPGATRLAPPPVPGIPLGSFVGGAAAEKRFDAVGRTAAVSLVCAGEGTLTLRIAQEPPTVLVCQASGPALAMLQSTGPLGGFTIAVTEDGPVRWALAVGTMPAT